jgi:phage replication O-like protein O
MSNPQPDKHTRIANEIIEKGFFKTNLTAYENRVVWVVLRKTYGWHKKFDRIPISQIATETGLSKQNARKIKKRLIGRNILITKGKLLGFNKHYEQWESHKTPPPRGVPGDSLGESQETPGGVPQDSQGGVPGDTSKETLKEKHLKEKDKERDRSRVLLLLWNEKAGSVLPQITQLTPTRRKAFREALLWRSLPDWAVVIDRILASEFLTGKRGWRATADWLFRDPTNALRVLEGEFDGLSQQDEAKWAKRIKEAEDRDGISIPSRD